MFRAIKCLALTLLLLALTVAATSEEINWQVISGGGTEAEGGGFKMSGTLGEFAVGHAEAAPNNVRHGYWQDFGDGGSGTCCTGPSVGNVDGSPDNLVTMGDLTVMIDHLFITLAPIEPPRIGDLDADCMRTMGDLTILIDHLFITLSPLTIPGCD